MIFRIHLPAYPLCLFVKNFVYYKDFQPSHLLERFLPDGYTNLVFDLTEQPKYIYDNLSLEKIQSCRQVWFSGIRREFITVPSSLDSEMLIINFLRGKAYPFLSAPLDEFTDRVVDGEYAWRKNLIDLRDLLLEQESVQEKFSCLERELIKQCEAKLTAPGLVDYAVNAIEKSPMQLTIESIVAQSGYSHKHFIQLFKKQLGLSPKAFLRILRFQMAVEEIEKQKVVSWANVAYDCGYYDQTHFIEDFKSFSGHTPAQYLQYKNDNLNWVPVIR